MNRRAFLTASLGALAAGTAPLSPARAEGKPKAWVGAEGPAVYFTKDISPAGLRKAFDALKANLPGKVGVKVSTGEPGGHNFLNPQLVKGLVQSLRANIVECNTAYGGRRGNLRDHIRAAVEHGWCDIATVDILDGVATMDLPAPEGAKRLRKDIVGANFRDYASFLVLSHFKGHAMGGFGGALKNLSIGFASRAGKCLIHTGGKTEKTWMGGEQLAFLEAMAEAATAVCRARQHPDVRPARLGVGVYGGIGADVCDVHRAREERFHGRRAGVEKAPFNFDVVAEALLKPSLALPRKVVGHERLRMRYVREMAYLQNRFLGFLGAACRTEGG